MYDVIKNIFRPSLGKEIAAYQVEQYLILLPCFFIILVGTNIFYLLAPLALGFMMDCVVAPNKNSWFETYIASNAVCIATYWGVGYFLLRVDINVPATSDFSIETILYGMVIYRFLLNAIVSGGMALQVKDFYTQNKEKI